LRDVPVLVMSARSLPEDRANAVEMGASAYLIKPFSRAEFTNQVDMLVRSSAGRLISSQVGFRRRAPRVLPEPRGETRPFSAQQIRNYVGYALGALGRHKVLAALVFALVALGTVGSVLVLPKEYYVETRIWAWRNQATQALGTASPTPADAPTHAASET